MLLSCDAHDKIEQDLKICDNIIRYSTSHMCTEIAVNNSNKSNWKWTDKHAIENASEQNKKLCSDQWQATEENNKNILSAESKLASFSWHLYTKCNKCNHWWTSTILYVYTTNKTVVGRFYWWKCTNQMAKANIWIRQWILLRLTFENWIIAFNVKRTVKYDVTVLSGVAYLL